MIEFLEERTIGDFSIVHFEISPEDAKKANFKMMFSYTAHRAVQPGKYTKIVEGNRIWMSDTTAERRDHITLQMMLDLATNHKVEPKMVLMFGLGIGYSASLAIEKGYSCKIVELRPEIIELVGAQLLQKYPGKVEIVQADALQYLPGEDDFYAVGWYDIWPDICTDNYSEYQMLYDRWRDHTFYQSAWAEDELLFELKDDCWNCDGSMQCPECDGEGFFDEDEEEWCGDCNGSGECEYCADEGGKEYSDEYLPEFKGE